MQQRKDEILAKKAKLAELIRQRELREKEFSASRQSIGDASELISPTPARANNRSDLDSLIVRLVGESRPGSTGPSGPGSVAAGRGSRPNSVFSVGELSVDNSEAANFPLSATSTEFQTFSPVQTVVSTFDLFPTILNIPSSLKGETVKHSKAIQTTNALSTQRSRTPEPNEKEDDGSPPIKTPRNSKRLNRREREREEELRQSIRREIEDELKALQENPASSIGHESGGAAEKGSRGKILNSSDFRSVILSEQFVDFAERSSKVAERALDEDYNILADYTLAGVNTYEEEGQPGGAGQIWEIVQFWDERWSKRRQISSVAFSPKFAELVLASYTKNLSAPHDPDGLIQVWNPHLHDRAEYIFHAQSDILTAKFSPFHPNLIIGGAYSGQVLLWDTRAKSAPVQKTPLTGFGHTHPVYAVDIVGTQNANNIISCSTDGVICGWTVDMLSQPQEFLELLAPSPAIYDDFAPTCMAFPHADPTYFLLGTEEGTIYPCHRYDRAGAKAGVDQRVSYSGHAAPVMSLDFHPSRGPLDLGDLVISSSLDWSVKLWKVRAPTAVAPASIAGSSHKIGPLLDFARDDIVYDAAWSPVKAGVFALVDGSGNVEVWDLATETEVPAARTQPSSGKSGRGLSRSLNKLAWEEREGKRLGTGGLDGSLTIFEVGNALGGADNVRAEEWSNIKKLVQRLEGGSSSLGSSVIKDSSGR
ncbi:MAG: hypothetical protein M1829_000717 [Trizodia sp. TS-e1964]|nr:MAG: hypothetical protein M1829_000717 [Trizodia sp. TS-e1964]